MSTTTPRPMTPAERAEWQLRFFVNWIGVKFADVDMVAARAELERRMPAIRGEFERRYPLADAGLPLGEQDRQNEKTLHAVLAHRSERQYATG